MGNVVDFEQPVPEHFTPDFCAKVNALAVKAQKQLCAINRLLALLPKGMGERDTGSCDANTMRVNLCFVGELTGDALEWLSNDDYGDDVQ